MARRNPLPSFHPPDVATYADMIGRVCGCSSKTARKLAEAYPPGYGLANATVAEIERQGATRKQAERLVGAFELARHDTRQAGHRHSETIRDPAGLMAYLRGAIGHREQESFVVVYLDARQRVIDTREAARGSLSAVDVHPREIFRDAVRMRAHSIILAHNHPSGTPEPSDADLQLTQRVAEVGRIVGIPVLDHAIVTDEGAVSLATLGLVPSR